MVLLKQRFLTFLVCLALITAGCAMFRPGQGSSFQFSHAEHQQVKKCEACHKPTDDGVGMPELKTCMICHKTIDNKKPPERTVASLFEEDGSYQAAHATALSDEIIFSHQSHTDDHEVACADCHQGIRQDEAITPADSIDMQQCVDCHDESGITAATAGGIDNCALCHKEVGTDTAPASHKQNWERLHGQASSDGSQEGMDQCSLCHTEESCNSCHQTQAPANHTNFWRERGHGVAVAMDRSECSTCHQSDYCASCHNTTSPRSHSGQWGGRKSRHCLNCHFPVSSENCSVCHQDGTPSHAMATPNPHNDPALNCRSCHGGTGAASLPHVDNGSDCAFCHR